MESGFKKQLEDLLSDVHSRARTDEVSMLIGGDADRFAAAWDIFCNGQPPLPQKMAWVLDVVTQLHPSHAARYVRSIAARLPYLQHPAERRAAAKILARTILPPETLGELADILFKWLTDPNMPITVRCSAMQVLYNITKLEPELKPELAMVIEVQMQYGSSGIVSRGRKLLGKLASEISGQALSEDQNT